MLAGLFFIDQNRVVVVFPCLQRRLCETALAKPDNISLLWDLYYKREDYWRSLSGTLRPEYSQADLENKLSAYSEDQVLDPVIQPTDFSGGDGHARSYPCSRLA